MPVLRRAVPEELDERPRLGVVGSGLRHEAAVGEMEEVFERLHAAPKPAPVVGPIAPEVPLAVLDLGGLVVLGQPLVEPERQVGEIVVEEDEDVAREW